ncbi:hypothetical protein [Photobacterium rosenbergii]|uniref:Uncharacterized protein n=1 Tax=Photobacterium rosenbergii TaxID=294936 RepID=A0ABU3ZEK2_9GAMM|nr:hypothetical protein [Photobacterium rosenbergii]MDV5168529.1 hypothetical protein [Photobacterium rosenbergii]
MKIKLYKSLFIKRVLDVEPTDLTPSKSNGLNDFNYWTQNHPWVMLVFSIILGCVITGLIGLVIFG